MVTLKVPGATSWSSVFAATRPDGPAPGCGMSFQPSSLRHVLETETHTNDADRLGHHPILCSRRVYEKVAADPDGAERRGISAVVDFAVRALWLAAVRTDT
jgi:hypothetical protein